MGERLDAYNASLEADRKYQEKMAQEAAIAEREYRELDNSVRGFKERIEENTKSYAKFSDTVKQMLLSEAIYSIYSPCLGKLTENSKRISENLVTEYVKEHGVTGIFMNMDTTYALETVQSLVNKYHKIIVEKVDKTDSSSFKVDRGDKNKFLDELDKEEDIEEVKNAISLRVANAEEEFVNNNLDDKMDMKEILNDTKTRIDANKEDRTTDADTKEDIEQEAVNLSKQRIDDIREKRPRGIFEHMVRLMSESIVKNEDLRIQYTNESGTLDMDSIVESARCFYGFLETVNTAKLEKVDVDYINSVFDQMK